MPLVLAAMGGGSLDAVWRAWLSVPGMSVMGEAGSQRLAKSKPRTYRGRK